MSLFVYRIDVMTADDVPEVSRVERRCFSNPWPAAAYRRELRNPAQNYYVVLRHVGDHPASPATPDLPHAGNGNGARSLPRRTLFPLPLGRRAETHGENGTGDSRIVGFAGMWNAFDEAHITTIAIDTPHRGRGLGEWLLAALFDEAVRRGSNWLTLEVRVSNEAAQALYRKWGFSVQGTRRRYYSDNNEDALIMWSRALSDAAYRAELAGLRRELTSRLAGLAAGGTALAAR